MTPEDQNLLDECQTMFRHVLILHITIYGFGRFQELLTRFEQLANEVEEQKEEIIKIQ